MKKLKIKSEHNIRKLKKTEDTIFPEGNISFLSEIKRRK